MGKKNRKQNPLESAGAAKQNAVNAAKEAEQKVQDAAEAAKDAAEELLEAPVDAAEALTEDIGGAAEEAEELLEETAEELAEDAGESAEEAADAIRAAGEALKDGAAAKSPAKKESAAAAEKPEKEKAEKKKHERTPEEEADRAINKTKRRKKFKYGALAAVVTAVVLACVVIVNVICHVLDDRYHWNIDLTSSGKYELDQQTIDYLHQLKNDIQIGMMVSEEDLEKDGRGFNIIVETLERFKKESDGHIDVEFIDMTKHPETVSRYTDNYDGDFQAGDAVLKCGDLTRVVKFSDLIKTEQTPNYMTMSYDYSYTFVGEQSLISAITGVTDLNPVKVAFINKTGGQPIYFQYDTPSFSNLLTLMEKNNYIITEVDLVNDSILPSDYDCAVLCAPYNDLTEAQIEKLSSFLYNDGQYSTDLVYFSSFYQLETPKLDDFLDTWGLKFERSVLIESDEKTSQVAPTSLFGAVSGVPVATVAEHDLNQNLSGSKLPVIVPYARPITLQFTTANNGRETQALLSTANTTIVRPLNVKDNEFDESAAEKGSYAVAAVATNSVIVDNTSHESRVIAFSSPMMVDSEITSSRAYANANYYITVLNNASGKDATLTIAEKPLTSSKITVSDRQVKWIKNIIVIFIPLVVAVLGIIVYIRRKNR